MPIRVGVVDDHAIVRTALRLWLLDHPDLHYCGEASNGSEAIELVATRPIDVLLLDLAMPGRGGLDIVASLRARSPATRILIFSASAEEHHARQSLKQGVQGFVHKSCDPHELVAAIRRVACGQRHLSDVLAQQLASEAAAGEPSPLHCLSKREFQVLLLLAQGAKSGAISQRLHLSVRTITLYRSRLIRKLNLATNSDLTYFAMKQGLLD